MVDYTTKILRDRFQKLMTELEMNGNEVVKDIKEKVLNEVFYYNESKESRDNVIEMDELNSRPGN